MSTPHSFIASFLRTRLSILVSVAVIILISFSCKHAAAQIVTSQTPTSSEKQAQMFDPFWTPRTVRDEKALKIIQKAASLMVSPSMATAGCTITASQVTTSTKGSSVSETVAWTVSGTEYVEDRRTDANNVIYNTNKGAPFLSHNGQQRSIPPHIAASLFSPSLAFRFLALRLNDPSYSFEYRGSTTIGSEPVSVVLLISRETRAIARATHQEWYFSESTGLPVRISYRLADIHNPAITVEAIADLSGYRSACGSLVPASASITTGGTAQTLLTITSIQ